MDCLPVSASAVFGMNDNLLKCACEKPNMTQDLIDKMLQNDFHTY